MPEEITQLSSRGTVTLPASLRKTLGLAEGDVFRVRVEGGAVILAPVILIEIERYTDEREQEFADTAAMSDGALRGASARWKAKRGQ